MKGGFRDMDKPDSKTNLPWWQRLERWKLAAVILAAGDFILVHIAYFVALWVRFDCAYSKIPANYLDHYKHFITPYPSPDA